MNTVRIKRTSTGYDGSGTLELGKSRVTFEGHLDQQQIEQLRRGLQAAQRWVDQRGPLDTAGGDFMSVFGQGVEMVGKLAKSPIGDAVATFGGPYGALAVAAARGAPDAVKAIKGVLGPAGPTAAALSHPDPKVREKAKPVVDAIVRDAKAGKPEAQKARLDLTAVMIKHKDMLLAERAKTIQKLKDQLAIYGDPLSYADTGAIDAVELYGFGDEGAPVVEGLETFDSSSYFDGQADTGAPPASLTSALDRALARSKNDPQPTFARRRAARG